MCYYYYYTTTTIMCTCKIKCNDISLFFDNHIYVTVLGSGYTVNISYPIRPQSYRTRFLQNEESFCSSFLQVLCPVLIHPGCHLVLQDCSEHLKLKNCSFLIRFIAKRTICVGDNKLWSCL